MRALIGWFLQPFRFAVIERHLRRLHRSPREALRVLDVGCGRSSPGLTCKTFPNCEYHSIDLMEPAEFIAIHGEKLGAHYHRLDLERGGLADLSGTEFDLVVISHVVEHLDNGVDVIRQAGTLLRKGGILFVEYPRLASVNLPSMEGTLNFHDDPTHKRFHDLVDVANAMTDGGLVVREARTRRYWRRILFVPIGALYSLLSKGRLRAGVFWDLCGFAEYAVGERLVPATRTDA